jgi:hypothetical protein
LAIGFSTLYAYQEYTEPYPFMRIYKYFFDSFNGWAQRQRRDWRDATTIIEMFLARRMFLAAQPLSAACPAYFAGEPV